MLCLTDIIFLFDLYKFSFLLLVEYSKRDESKVGPLSAYEVEHFKICLLCYFISVFNNGRTMPSVSQFPSTCHTLKHAQVKLWRPCCYFRADILSNCDAFTKFLSHKNNPRKKNQILKTFISTEIKRQKAGWLTESPRKLTAAIV